MARRDITGAVDFQYLETYAGGDPVHALGGPPPLVEEGAPRPSRDQTLS